MLKLPPGTRWSPRSLFSTIVPRVKRRESYRLGNVGNGGHTGSPARWEEGGSLKGGKGKRSTGEVSVCQVGKVKYAEPEGSKICNSLNTKIE